MIKALIIFIAGIIETFLYAGYIIAVTKKQVLASSILMFVYMTIYLGIIYYIVKDINSITLVLVYALSCAIGNFIRIKREKDENKR